MENTGKEILEDVAKEIVTIVFEAFIGCIEEAKGDENNASV